MAARAQTLETIVGAGVVAAAAGFLVFAFTSAQKASAASGYPLTAIFERVDGVAIGSDVRLSGVKVGAVSSINLDPSTYQAKVGLTIDPSVKIPSDSVAKVSSDGLLGGAYVSLEPGADTEMLKKNDKIIDTRGSIDLLTLLMQFASSQSKGGGEAAPEEPAQ